MALSMPDFCKKLRSSGCLPWDDDVLNEDWIKNRMVRSHRSWDDEFTKDLTWFFC
jgi:hypothetical protein